MVYRVIADGIDIFGSDAESSLLSPSLELELNSAGSFEFTLPPDHSAYDDISLMQSEIEVYEDGDLIFFGRPAEVNIDWNKQKIITCEGALAYLNDAAIRPHTFEQTLISDVFKYIIAQYNAQVTQDKQFIVGNITITDRYVYTSFDYDICLSVLISTCIDSTGGYLFLRKEDNGIYIDWLADVPDASDQPVQFASNLLDLKQDKKAEDICTVVLPLGGDVDGSPLTIASVNDDSDILEYADGISLYGRILKIQTWNDILDAQVLKDKAQAWLEEQNSDVLTIEADAAELHYLDGSVGAYHIGQKVNVISGPHGIDKEVPILKMSMSLDSGVKKVTLGTPPRKELTELSGITNSTGGSGGSSGGGGGGGTSGVTDVLVNGSSVVSDRIARVSVPTDTVTTQQMNTAISTATAGLASTSDVAAAVAPKANTSDVNTALALKADTSDVTAALALKADKTELVDVEANPAGTGSTDLAKLKVGSTVYNIPSGSSYTAGKYIEIDNGEIDVKVTPPYSHDWYIYNIVTTDTSGSGASVRVTKTDGKTGTVLSNTVYGFGQCMGQNAKNIDGFFELSYAKYVGSNWSYKLYVDSTTHTAGFRQDWPYNTSIYYTEQNGEDDSHAEKIKIALIEDLENYVDKITNTISMASCYSTDEKVVGRWTDGRPLYQKTFKNIGVTLQQNTWTNTGIPFTGIDHWEVIFNKSNTSNYDNQYPMLYRFNNGNFQAFCQYTIPLDELTLQYTKSTDTAGTGPTPGNLIYLPALYSEEEREVGVWTDGKPLYQKSVKFTIGSSLNSWQYIEHHIQNIDHLLFYGDVNVNGTIYSSGAQSGGNIMMYANGTYCGINVSQSAYVGGYAELTLQYTKTTDTAGSGKYLPDGQYAHHYSTSEHVVGTWVDGSTLYEKTYVKTLPSMHDHDSGYSYLIDSDVSYMDKIISAVGILYESGGACTALNGGMVNMNGWAYSIHKNRDDELVLYANVTSTYVGGGVAYVTIRYTKSS